MVVSLRQPFPFSYWTTISRAVRLDVSENGHYWVSLIVSEKAENLIVLGEISVIEGICFRFPQSRRKTWNEAIYVQISIEEGVRDAASVTIGIVREIVSSRKIPTIWRRINGNGGVWI